MVNPPVREKSPTQRRILTAEGAETLRVARILRAGGGGFPGCEDSPCWWRRVSGLRGFSVLVAEGVRPARILRAGGGGSAACADSRCWGVAEARNIPAAPG